MLQLQLRRHRREAAQVNQTRRRDYPAPAFEVAQEVTATLYSVSRQEVVTKAGNRFPWGEYPGNRDFPLAGDMVRLQLDDAAQIIGYIMLEPVGVPEQIKANLAGVREVVGVRLEARIAALRAAIDTLRYDAHHGKSTEITDLAQEYETWLSRA